MITRICNGRIVDPAQELDEITDLWIDGRIIAGIGPSIRPHADQTIDASGCIVSPGWVDIHVHLREPGFEEDETIATGTQAALAGGVTSVACMPDTEPAVDSQAAAEFIHLQAQRARGANVFPIGAVTKNREGRELAEIGRLAEGGAVAFTDHDRPIVSAEIMRRALEYCRMFDKPVLSHPQDPDLTHDGVMNEGFFSMKLGLKGMPNAAEEVFIFRDIELAKLTGGRLHILNVSTAGGVELIRRAKQAGVAVTAEVCPHHLLYTDEKMQTFDSSYKVSPPLRTEQDRQALIEGLRDGTLDAIASDHSPLAPEKTTREIDLAPFGGIGLETLLPICIKALIEPGHLTWPQLIAKTTIGPARILGLDRGTLRPGAAADITIIDPGCSWKITPSVFRSKSRNSPFLGEEVRGRATHVFVAGELRYCLSRAD